MRLITSSTPTIARSCPATNAAGASSTDHGAGSPAILRAEIVGGDRVGAGSVPSMIEAGMRARGQPAPPHVVAESLTEPDRDPARPWLLLHDDEQRPTVVEARPPQLVVWSSLWPRQPEALVRFDLTSDGHGGTDLRWTLLVEDLPGPSRLGHYRKRINQLINANLRYSYGR
jgi:hypothetical protein